jgi:hypothetical protein
MLVVEWLALALAVLGFLAAAAAEDVSRRRKARTYVSRPVKEAPRILAAE